MDLWDYWIARIKGGGVEGGVGGGESWVGRSNCLNRRLRDLYRTGFTIALTIHSLDRYPLA